VTFREIYLEIERKGVGGSVIILRSNDVVSGDQAWRTRYCQLMALTAINSFQMWYADAVSSEEMVLPKHDFDRQVSGLLST